MTNVIHPFQLLAIALAGWLNRHQQAVIDYLIEENRVLKDQLDGQCLRFTDEQRIRLAVKAKVLGRRALDEIELLVTPNTVKNILKRHGIEPAPEREKHTSWATFLKVHWNVMAATDFFTVEVWTLRGLVTYYVLFIMHLETRSVHIAGVTTAPNGAFMKQAVRNLTDVEDGFLLNSEFLIMDRDKKYTKEFRSSLKREDVTPVRCPVRAPNCNAFAERFVRSIKDECLGRMILFEEVSLRRVLREYVSHYHIERNHQGVGNRLLKSPEIVSSINDPVHCRERLGGMLNFYYLEAA